MMSMDKERSKYWIKVLVMSRRDDFSITSYKRTPATLAGAKLPRISHTPGKGRVQVNESKVLAQQAMVKYNLTHKDSIKYQEFIKLLSTFDQCKCCLLCIDNAELFVQQALEAAKEMREEEYK